MTMKRSLSILIVIITANCFFFNCKRNPVSKIATPLGDTIAIPFDSASVNLKGDKKFLEAISNIKILDLPLTFWCGAESYIWTKDLGLDIITEKAPENSGMIGRLIAQDNRIYIVFGIVGDIIYPYLYIYDKNGNQLDSMYLHLGYCVGGEQVWSTATRIESDLSLHMFDTVKYMNVSRWEGFDNPIFYDSVVVRERKMKLDSNGKYYISDEQKRNIGEFVQLPK